MIRRRKPSITYIVVTCPYTRGVWSLIYQAFGRQLPQGSATIIDWWRRLRSDWTGTQRSGMDSLFPLVSWEVWKQRNARCFRDAALQPIEELIPIIQAEADRWMEAGAAGMASLRAQQQG